MISKEQIIEAAKAHNPDFQSSTFRDVLEPAFIAGAEWVQSQPMIKPLEWTKSAESQMWFCHTLLGMYCIEPRGNTFRFEVAVGQDSWGDDVDYEVGQDESFEEAKSAAHSHYESRIKQCLI